MPIRRKSTQQRAPRQCSYHEQMRHERNNQLSHETRQRKDDDHDPTPCWCCCDDCRDLNWHYTARKGVWWEHNESGALEMVRDSSDCSGPARDSSSIPTLFDGSGVT